MGLEVLASKLIYGHNPHSNSHLSPWLSHALSLSIQKGLFKCFIYWAISLPLEEKIYELTLPTH